MPQYRLLSRKDFPKGRFEPFKEPTFLSIDQLDISGVYCPQLEDFVNLLLSDVNVLYCHGNSTPTKMWVHSSGQSIPEIIDEFRDSNRLDGVIVCNPGGYQLPHDLLYLSRNDGVSPQTLLFSENDGLSLVVTNFSQRRPEIHLSDKVLAAHGK